jgi:mevalonate kinase
MDSIVEKVNKLCRSVLELTEQDLQAVDTIAQEQASYTHPLKVAKQAKVNELGNHNQRVLSALRNLRQVLIDGESK